VDAHNGGLEAQNGALEGQWLQIPVTLKRSRIGIRIRIKVLRIHNPGREGWEDILHFFTFTFDVVFLVKNYYFNKLSLRRSLEVWRHRNILWKVTDESLNCLDLLQMFL
jgi:hypothetical protein